jgi:hypothetical protein
MFRFASSMDRMVFSIPSLIAFIIPAVSAVEAGILSSGKS